MKIYNTLSKQLEDFKPIDKDEVRIYSCGPTVYDRAHIGNLSAYIFADTLRRALELEGYTVKHVMNYTDVDDKTIKQSQEKYPDLEPKEALKKLTDEYKKLFLQDMKKIGVDTTRIQFISAVDSIPAMQQLINKLIQEKIAYITDDGVYFSIKAYKDKGKKYGQLLNISTESTSEARIDNDEYDKESVHDFALWKVQKANEPAWNFEIDGKQLNGRPGWHIECSAMSEAALGLPFDVHTGGIDLVFPHHENEIAQSTAVGNQNTMANYFVHNNHILVDGRKMAKSAQNFYTLDDITSKGFDPLAFRLLVLQAHYRSEVNFTFDSLDSAQSRLNALRNLFSKQYQINPNFKPEWAQGHQILAARERFLESIFDNLNLPAVQEQLASLEDDVEAGINSDGAPEFKLYLNDIEQVLGLKLDENQDISNEHKQLIWQREEARKNKNWEESDKLRAELEKKGIGVRDTEHGPIWYRI